MNKKNCFYLIIILVITFSLFNVKASDDIYDVVLLWGQSNMTGSAGIYTCASTATDCSDEKMKDKNLSKFSMSEFSSRTGINQDILENYSAVNHVDVNIPSGSVFEYRYIDNKLQELTRDTKTIGEDLKIECDDNNKCELNSTDKLTYSIQESFGTNIAPQFGKDYYEKTGHKVVIVLASNGGEPIQNFLPYNQVQEYYGGSLSDKAKQHIYEATVEKYNAAIKYLSQTQKVTIGNKFYVVFQGESDRGKEKNKYIETYIKVHQSLKDACGLTFGAIIETGGSAGIHTLEQILPIYEAQEDLIKNNSDIILATAFPYNNFNKNVDDANLSACITDAKDNRIHFNSAALSQIGRESATNVFKFLKNEKKHINKVTVDNEALSLDNGVYSCNVDADKSKVTIDVSLNNYINLDFVSGYGPREVNVDYGKNEYLIKLRLNDNSIIEQKVVINRKKVAYQHIEVPDTGKSNRYAIFISFLLILSGGIIFCKNLVKKNL